MKTSRILELAGLPNQQAKLLEAQDMASWQKEKAKENEGTVFSLVHYTKIPFESASAFYCDNKKLTSLKGSPTLINGEFNCSKNNLTSFEGAPRRVVGNFYADHNKFTSLHNIHNHIKCIEGEIFLNFNPIKSHVLGLLLIDGLTEVNLDNGGVQIIINKYLKGKHFGSSRDIEACKQELIKDRYDDFAQL